VRLSPEDKLTTPPQLAATRYAILSVISLTRNSATAEKQHVSCACMVQPVDLAACSLSVGLSIDTFINKSIVAVNTATIFLGCAAMLCVL